jgi:hypothetical protein
LGNKVLENADFQRLTTGLIDKECLGKCQGQGFDDGQDLISLKFAHAEFSRFSVDGRVTYTPKEVFNRGMRPLGSDPE